MGRVNMGRGRSKFKQSDVTRAIKAAGAAGIEIAYVEITPDGVIKIVPKSANASATTQDTNEWDEKYGVNPWDEVLLSLNTGNAKRPRSTK